MQCHMASGVPLALPVSAATPAGRSSPCSLNHLPLAAPAAHCCGNPKRTYTPSRAGAGPCAARPRCPHLGHYRTLPVAFYQRAFRCQEASQRDTARSASSPIVFLKPEGYERLLPYVLHYAEAESNKSGEEGQKRRSRPRSDTDASASSVDLGDSQGEHANARRAIVTDKDAVAGFLGPILLLVALAMNTIGAHGCPPARAQPGAPLTCLLPLLACHCLSLLLSRLDISAARSHCNGDHHVQGVSSAVRD